MSKPSLSKSNALVFLLSIQLSWGHQTANSNVFTLILYQCDVIIRLPCDLFCSLHENPVTFVFVLCIFALYFLLLVISIRLDRHDAMKGSIVHLVDNKGHDKQTYMVTLETGFRKGAGTTAKVRISFCTSSYIRLSCKAIAHNTYSIIRF